MLTRYLAALLRLFAPLRTAAWWDAALERAASQAAEKILAVIVITGSLTIADVDWLLIFGVGLGGALVSLLFSLLSLPAPDTVLPKPVALLWRTLRTFLNAVLTLLAVDVFNVFTFDWAVMLSIAVTTTFFAVLKSLIVPPRETVPVLTATT